MVEREAKRGGGGAAAGSGCRAWPSGVAAGRGCWRTLFLRSFRAAPVAPPRSGDASLRVLPTGVSAVRGAEDSAVTERGGGAMLGALLWVG